MDFFNEWIVKKKRDTKDALFFASSVFAAIVLVYLILIQMSAGALTAFVPLELLAVGYGLYFLLSLLSVEYEYSVVNGDMDVDKITGKRRRKRLVSVKLREIEYFSRFDEKSAGMIKNVNTKNIVNASSALDGDNVYIAVFYNNSQKTYLLFEPTEKMIENFSKYIPRSLNHTL